jgi:hypothetical protein
MDEPLLDEKLVSEIGLTFGLTFFIGFMLFIIWDLARKSNAGPFGTFILFFVLAFGILGFIIKNVLQWFLDI